MADAELSPPPSPTDAGQSAARVLSAFDGGGDGGALGYALIGIDPDLGIEHAVASGAFGLLTAALMGDDAGSLAVSDLSEPQIASCLAMLLKRDLGASSYGDDRLDAVELVFPALAVLKPQTDDSTAGGLARAVIGDGGRPPAGFDVECCGAVVEIDGVPVATGAGAAVLGHPARALAWLAGVLAETGRALPAGAVILIGTLTRPVDVERGHARVLVGGLGSATLRLA